MNKWLGMGRWVKDTDYRTSQSGTSVAKNTIAVDRKENAEWTIEKK